MQFQMKSFVSKAFNAEGTFAPIAILLFTLSFILRFIALKQTEFTNGWDSYFYLVQIQSWHETGSMHSPEWTLFYPVLWIIDLFSPDYITSVKILSALLAAVFTWVVFIASENVQPSRLISIRASAYTVFSPELTYFSAQWPKNLLGVILLILLLNALWKNNWKWIIGFLILGFFAHRMTAVLGLGIVTFTSIRKHIPVKVWVGLLALSCLLVITSQLIPGILNIRDIGRLNHLIVTTPQFPIISFNRIFGLDKISILWQAELWIALLLAIVAGIRFYKTKGIETNKEGIISLLVLLLVLWFPFYYWETGSASYRFFHVGVLLIPLFLIFTIPAEGKKYLQYPALFTLLTAACFSWKAYNPALQDPPYELYKLVTEKTQEQLQQDRKPELIIAHKSLAEFYSFTTKTDAMPWIPDYKIAPDKLWRIAVLPYPQLFEFYTKHKPAHLASSYYFIHEREWQQFISALKEHESPDVVEEHLTWKNPNEVRPAFLRK